MRKYESIHEKISVLAEFSPGRKPLIHYFIWEGRKYEVLNLNLVNREFAGETTVVIFSVDTKNGAYQLRLDTDTLQWWLEQIYWEQ